MRKYFVIFMFIILMAVTIQSVNAQDKIVISIGCDQGPSESIVYVAAKAMADELERLGNGRIEVKLYDAAVLGDVKDMIEQVKIGSLDIQMAVFPNVAVLFPELGFFSLSYLFESFDHNFKVLRDPVIMDKLKDVVIKNNQGIMLLAATCTGCRNVYNNKRSVITVDDMRGLKMRVMTNPIEAKVWSSFGAMPTAMPVHEIYSAMQTGVIDAAESTIPAITYESFYEVAPYISRTQHQFAIGGLFMNEKKYNSLPDDIQKIVDEAASNAAVVGLELNKGLEEKYIMILLDKPGVTINAVNKTGFINMVKPIQNEVAKEFGMEEILDLIKKEAE